MNTKIIPTAEEFLRKNIDYVLEKDCKEDVENAMIEFAKLHVEAALKVKGRAMQEMSNEDSSFSIDELNAFTKNCYPLSNIK